MKSQVNTRFLVLSDTHGAQLTHSITENVDVVIHCGDLTEESKLEEFKAALSLLKQINAPLKLVIAGNHDFTLDVPRYQKQIELFESTYGTDTALIDREFGAIGEARRLFESKEAKDSGIMFLDEGVHKIALENGALLTAYASPYTPSSSNMGFQYNPKEGEHHWAVNSLVDIVITHGPPEGILDHTGKARAGSPSLFQAVARARPRLHCFGHIHEAWGAKLVSWRDRDDDNLSHFTTIDNDASTVIETLRSMRSHRFDTPEMSSEKQSKRRALDEKGYCTANATPTSEMHTLFINAAIEGPADNLQQWPWRVDINLPKLSKKRRLSGTDTEKPEKRVRG